MGEQGPQGEPPESEVTRDASGLVLDSDGHPIIHSASYKVAAIQGAHQAREILDEAAQAELAKSSSSQEAYDAVEAVKSARDAEEAALWRSRQHYKENMEAYVETAKDEDQRRAEGNHQGES